MPTLRELRERKGWSQREAATRVGVHPLTWGDWEHGRTTPHPRHLRALARLFEVSAVEIELPQATPRPPWRRVDQ